MLRNVVGKLSLPRPGTTPEKFENGVFSLKIKCFPLTVRRRNLKTQQSLVKETLNWTLEGWG